MDATQNDSASGTTVEEAENADKNGQQGESVNEAAAEESAATEPQPAEPEAPATAPESGAGKAKKRKTAPKSTKAAATKSLVVFREGKVHYADETVVVLDLDDAAHPDTDVHDVVDKLAELRDAIESPGRAEAVSLVAELIQTKALA